MAAALASALIITWSSRAALSTRDRAFADHSSAAIAAGERNFVDVADAHVCKLRAAQSIPKQRGGRVAMCGGRVAMCATTIASRRPTAVVLIRPTDDPSLSRVLEASVSNMGLSLLQVRDDGGGEDVLASLFPCTESGVEVVAVFELSLSVGNSMAVFEACEARGCELFRWHANVAMYKRLVGTLGPSWLAAGDAAAVSEDAVAEANGWGYLAGDEEAVVDVKAATDEEIARLLHLDPVDGAGGAAERADEAAPPLVSALGYLAASDGRAPPLAPELTDMARSVLVGKATEPAWSNTLADGRPLPDESADGTFLSPLTGAPLFAASQRRRSTTGWPSFVASAGPMASHLTSATDLASGAPRVECVEASSGAHLGHDFDGSLCINAAALVFVERGQPQPAWLPEAAAPAMAVTLRERPDLLGIAQVASFAGGCFWSLNTALGQQPGVLACLSGYTALDASRRRGCAPSYKEVCSGTTGHVETVQLAFDPRQTSYTAMLAAFWQHLPDPTSSVRQGADVGPQYESAIFYHSEAQRREAVASRDEAARRRRDGATVVTRISPADAFWRAEQEHQRR